jgi:hypothetical protein
MSSAGFTRPGIKCEHCGLPFSLSLTGAIGAREVKRLPDPFEAKCPMCDHTAMYPKSSIQALVAVGPR